MASKPAQRLIEPQERPLAEALAALDYANPFLAERTALERLALGPDFDESDAHWQLAPDPAAHPPNVARLSRLAEDLVTRLHARLEHGARAEPHDLALYEDLVLFHLYHSHRDTLADVIEEALTLGDGRRAMSCYVGFEQRAGPLLHPRGVRLPSGYEPQHVFAFAFQVCRAFFHIYRYIVGSSPAAIALRAAIWQSIFTHDLRRYVRALYRRLADVSTLVTGPSGTGKELVARAVGHSGYIPFDAPSRRFTQDFVGLFHPLNLSALSPTLIESELFGHRKGAFTGALDDRPGWFEASHALGTVFLDEIGETDLSIQVKLLRVLETRSFQRLGETRARRFEGRVLCATNRDLEREMRAGRFREDLYYRICSDRIVTPSLEEQLRGGAEGELHRLVLFIARRMAGDEAAALADEVVGWIDAELGPGYAWPGNFRELEQCVRSVMIRGAYRPSRQGSEAPLDELTRGVGAAEFTAEELLVRYPALVYARAGSYEAAARRLGLDRRTVKAKVDEAWLARLRGGAAG